MDGRIPSREELARFEAIRAHVGEQYPRVRVRTPRARAPQTEITLCVVCGRAYPLRAHDTLTCARKHGLDGNAVYVLQHREAGDDR